MGQANYEFRLLDWNANPIAIFSDVEIRAIEIQRRLNDYDIHTFSIDGNDPRCELFNLDYMLEVYRKVDRPGATWYKEYGGFHRTPQQQRTTAENDIFTSYGRGYVDLVNRRTILYPSGNVFTSKSGPGETVMKEYVEENAGPSANSGVRKIDGVTRGFTVDASNSRGTDWNGKREWDNLLDVIKDISRLTGVDFAVQRGPGATFTFSTPIGADRSETVLFSTLLGNMINPLYVESRTEEVTAACALGRGEGAARLTQSVIDDASTASPWNQIEMTVEGRNSQIALELITTAEEALKDNSAQPSFTFDVLQTDMLQYGADYFVGDTVRAVYKSLSVDLKIVGCVLALNEGRETIRPIFQEFTTLADDDIRNLGMVSQNILSGVLRNMNKKINANKSIEMT